MSHGAAEHGFSERYVPKDFTWPGGARLAVALTFDTQAGVGLPTTFSGLRKDFRGIKEHEYEGRVGIRRVLEILDRHGVRATFPTCAETVQLFPDPCEDIVRRGHEMAAHGYHHERLNELTVDEERKVIAETVRAFQEALGVRPRGWRSPFYLSTVDTARLLAEQGFTWNSDFHNDDLPYLMEFPSGSAIVQIPPQIDDWRLYWADIHAPSTRAVRGTPRNILSVVVDAFDVLRRESEHSPKLLCVTFHPQIVGRPDRSIILDGLLSHARNSGDGVWWATCAEIVEAVRTELGWETRVG